MPLFDTRCVVFFSCCSKVLSLGRIDRLRLRRSGAQDVDDWSS